VLRLVCKCSVYVRVCVVCVELVVFVVFVCAVCVA